jgi:hypothetical protein
MCQVIHRFICKECGRKEDVIKQSDTIFDPIMTLPPNWSWMKNGYVCNNHIITITDKPEESIQE